MFLDVKELAVRKINIHKIYAPGSIDYGINEVKQAGPLEVNATAELLEGHIRVVGMLETKVEMVCARCLEPVIEDVHRDFDLFYQPLVKGYQAGRRAVEGRRYRRWIFFGRGPVSDRYFEGAGIIVIADESDLPERLSRIVRQLRRQPQP